MRKVFALLILTLLTAPLCAQQKTLIEGPFDHGFFGGATINTTITDDGPVILTGGRLGLIFDRRLIVSGGLYRTNTESSLNGFLDYNLRYGGLELEFVSGPDRLIHLDLYTLVGAGFLDYKERLWDDEERSRVDDFLIIKPGIMLEANITESIRGGIGLAYDYLIGIYHDDEYREDFNGPQLIFSAKFGEF